MEKGRRAMNSILCLILISMLTLTSAVAQTSQGTGLSYQGRLNDGGSPADGLYDFEFTLYDGPDPSVDNPVTTPIQIADVQVSDGLFTVEIDFGDNFQGDARWLEIKVGPSGGTLTQLLPTQLLTSVPYAVHALSINDTGVTAGTYGSSTLIPRLTIGSDGRISSVTNLTLDPRDNDCNASNELNSSLTMIGTQLQLTDAGGTLSQDLSSLVDDEDWAWSSGSGLTGNLYRTGKVGIGTNNPDYDFVIERQANANINPMAVFRTIGTNSAAAVRFTNASSNFFNMGITGNNDFALAYNNNISLSSDLVRITSAGNVGIGTTSPSYPLHVVTDQAYGGYFDSTATTGTARGLHGRAEGAAGGAVGTLHYGLYGSAKNAYNNVGVFGEASGGTNNYGGYFSGQLYASGNTGIGKTLPTAKLHVLQINAAEAVRIEDETGDTTPFVIDQDGNVGIGQPTPLAPLHVSGDTLVDGLFAVGTTAPSAYVHIVNQGSAYSAFRVDDEVGDTTPFVISNVGSIGIRTSSPEAPLDFVFNDRTVQFAKFEYGFPWNISSAVIAKDSEDTMGALAHERHQFEENWTYRYGVYAIAEDTTSSRNYGIYAAASEGTYNWAGYFEGDVTVTGNLSKGSGSFKIDHPLDPENKYLQHSFVESPDMMNVYNGNVVLDENGEYIVTLPDWFEALNKEFRYQLTCIGGFAPVYIAEEMNERTFKIAGGTPGLKVSWQITGIRQDPYAAANPIPVELDKAESDKGKFLHPEAYGYDRDKGIGR
ncbi:hypothetical protein JXQ70_10600 [bacterium]|nr:hypothetical protein [bacterium]